MARDQRDAQEELELAVDVAKLKVRVAAEKAEPGRLLKQGIRSAPLGSVAGAIGSGALLALMAGRRAKPGKAVGSSAVGAGKAAGLGALALSLAAELASRYLPDLLDKYTGSSSQRR